MLNDKSYKFPDDDENMDWFAMPYVSIPTKLTNRSVIDLNYLIYKYCTSLHFTLF